MSIASGNVDLDKVKVIHYGLRKIRRGDSAMVFFVLINNVSKEAQKIKLEQVTCCQHEKKGPKDCVAFVLKGTTTNEVKAETMRNYTLLYQTTDIHDRQGYCELNVVVEGGKQGKVKIEFNTDLDDILSGKTLSVVDTFFFPNEVIATCQSIDEDRLSNCMPYNCFMRYNGYLNYFNNATRRCVKAVACEAKENEALFDPLTNTCKGLSEYQKVSAEDITGLKSMQYKDSSLYVHGYPINVHCHSGKINKAHGWCDCNPGWGSAEIDMALFNPDTSMYHMCSEWLGSLSHEDAQNISHVKHKTWDDLDVNLIVLGSLASAIFLLILVFLGLVCQSKRKLRKKGKKKRKVRMSI